MAYSISGTVFNDANGNGIQDAGESGLNHITVAVYDSTAGFGLDNSIRMP